MFWTSRIYHFAWPMLALTVLWIASDTCSHTVYNTSTTVTVFEDVNANGKQDSGEPALSDALIVADFNIYGDMERSMDLSDARGQAIIHAQYTNFFYVTAVPPCGYRPITETRRFDASKGQVQVGFAPVSPRAGTATLQFHLWQDQDEDSQQDAGEPALGSVTLYADPLAAGGARTYLGALAIKTDSEGKATLKLGKSCGKLWVQPPRDWMTSSITPDNGSDKGWQAIPYDLGTTTVEWGLRPVHELTPTP